MLDTNDMFLYSCALGDLNMVKSVVNRGIDINFKKIKRGFAHSPLSLAARKGHLEVVRYLVDNGARFDGMFGQAILMAVKGGNLEIVKYLVDKGADPEFSAPDCILNAAGMGYLNIVKYLVNYGIDMVNRDGFAVVAAMEGKVDVANYLIELGADITADDHYLLNWVKRKNKHSVVDYIVNLILKEMKKYTLMLLLNRKKKIHTGENSLVVHKDLTELAFKPRYVKSYEYYQEIR